MIDQKTPNLELPLPHPDNELRDDVVRIRESLTRIDGVAQSLFSLVASDDVNLDTVQEIVAVLKHAQTDIADITDVLATKAFSAEVNVALALKADSATVSQQLALKADSSVVTQTRQTLEQEMSVIRANPIDARKFRQVYDLNMEAF